VLAPHPGTDAAADLIQRLGRDDVDVGGDLQHRILAGVEDQRSAAHVLGAEGLDRLDPVVDPVADHPAPARRVADDRQHRLGEAIGVCRRATRGDEAHQLVVAGRRVLARPQRVQAPVEHRRGRRRHTEQRTDAAEPQRTEGRQIQAAEMLGEMAERVGVRVAVVVGVGQRADPAGVDHDHEGATHRRVCPQDRVAPPAGSIWARG
jgi:hypothetical protein